jgi:hypothetical protein
VFLHGKLAVRPRFLIEFHIQLARVNQSRTATQQDTNPYSFSAGRNPLGLPLTRQVASPQELVDYEFVVDYMEQFSEN